MTDIEQIKRELSQDIDVMFSVSSDKMRAWQTKHSARGQSIALEDNVHFWFISEIIDYLHSRGYLGGVWQPIETAPKDKPILVCQSQNGIVRTARGVNDRGDWITGPSPMDYIVKITHWMPLPAAPKGEMK